MTSSFNYDERTKKRIINPNAKFILVGNTIDGFLSFNFREFINFDEVKLNLFDILSKKESAGEWRISLYQVRDDYKIHKKYGYYKVPNKGKLIFEHSYMDWPVRKIIFNKTLMTIIGTTKGYIENLHSIGVDFHDFNIDIEVLKIKIH